MIGQLFHDESLVTRHLIDDAGHMPHMERPAEVQAAIEETIARST